MTAMASQAAKLEPPRYRMHPSIRSFPSAQFYEVHAGGPGVDPASAATELHLATEEGASDAKGVSKSF